jgi:hypothetical protein
MVARMEIAFRRINCARSATGQSAGANWLARRAIASIAVAGKKVFKPYPCNRGLSEAPLAERVRVGLRKDWIAFP